MNHMTKAQLELANATLHEQLLAANHDFEQVATKLAGVVADNVKLRELCAQRACKSRADDAKISQLKRQIPRITTVDAFRDRCTQYCEQHGVRSVPAHVARTFRS